MGSPLKGYPQRSNCEPFTTSTFQALRAPTPCTLPVGSTGTGGGSMVGADRLNVPAIDTFSH